MRRFRPRRPSPALVVGLTALVFAMAPTADALRGMRIISSNDFITGAVDKRAIRTGAVDRREIRRDAVGINEMAEAGDPGGGRLDGRHINEARLGEVPAAADADKLGGLAAGSFLLSTQRLFESNDPVTNNYPAGAALATLSSLPAGDYLAIAKLTVDNDGGAVESVSCTLNVPGTTDDVQTGSLGAEAAPAEQLPFALSTRFNSSSTASLNVACTNPSGDNDATNIRVVAVLTS